MSSSLKRLHDYGQSFWWDSLSRHAIETGSLAKMRDEDGMRGITSNPSIFQKAIRRGDDYDARISKLHSNGQSAEALFWKLAIADIQDACDLLADLYRSTEGADGFVSLEVNPHLAHDTEGTLAQAKDLWSRVNRPNLMIKIPGTPEGVPAIRQALIAGVNINVTLLFSQQAHIDVMDAYLDALEVRLDAGDGLSSIAGVASFFVSRVDTLIDSKLDALDDERAEALRGKAGIANAKLAYQNFQERFSGERWEKLAAAGARVQRPLWASTSTKDERYSRIMYVDPLIGEDTVNTLPTVTLDAYREEGNPKGAGILEGVEEARAQLAGLEELGIPMDEITDQLLSEGVEKFNDAFDGLLGDLEAKMKEIAAA